MMRLTITNEFHGSTAELSIPSIPHSLSAHQQRKVRETCGNADCQCHQFTVHGPHGERLDYEIGAGDDGRWLIVGRDAELTTLAAAAIAKVSYPTIHRAIEAGTLPVSRMVGSHRRLSLLAVRAWVAAGCPTK